MLWQNFRRIDGFGKVLVKHLSPVGEVPTQEYVFELHKGVDVSHVNFLRSTDEVVDRFVDHELDAELARVLVNFGLLFIAGRVALQLVYVAQRRLFGPGFLGLKEWQFLVDGGHGGLRLSWSIAASFSKV